MAKNKPSELCTNCAQWEAFNDKCWFFWEKKKECANHTEGFKTIREEFEINQLNQM